MSWVAAPGFDDLFLHQYVMVAVGAKIVVPVILSEIGDMGDHVARTAATAPMAIDVAALPTRSHVRIGFPRGNLGRSITHNRISNKHF